jgi:ABC-2 type transport system permease protein
VAGVMNFGIILFFWVIRWAAYNAGPVWGDFLGYLSIIDHFEDFSRGVFNTKDLVFYLSAVGLWLFMTYKTLESYSWRS